MPLVIPTFPLAPPTGQCLHYRDLLCDYESHRNNSEGNNTGADFTSSLNCSHLHQQTTDSSTKRKRKVWSNFSSKV